jgi:nucleoside-diphosphate-sugar epimerase
VKRSFTYVADIASGVCAVLDAPALSYDVYNNSSTEWTTMAEVVAMLKDLRPDLRTIDVPEKDLPGRASGMDVTRIEEDVGFVAQFDLATGLRDYLAWRQATGFTE